MLHPSYIYENSLVFATKGTYKQTIYNSHYFQDKILPSWDPLFLILENEEEQQDLPMKKMFLRNEYVEP